jgi:soluble lytic murein transglycosylase
VIGGPRRSIGLDVSALLLAATAVAPALATSLDELLERRAPDLPPSLRERIVEAVGEARQRHGIDPLLLLALIERESHYLPTALGPRGALGLMQVKPSIGRAVAATLGLPPPTREDLVDPRTSILLGAAYLASLRDQMGDMGLALEAYNRGPERLKRRLQSDPSPPLPFARRVLRLREELAAELRGSP